MRNILNTAVALAALAVPAMAQAQDGEDERGSGVRRTEITPYIEASQVVTAELQPGNDVVTYTQLAAGVDAGFGGRNSGGSVSLRYERRIGWGQAEDVDTVSGLARASVALVPRTLSFEAGALAARTRVEGNGATTLGGFGASDDGTSQIYSIYAGPTLSAEAGDVQVTGGYRIGYTRVESPDAVTVAPGEAPVDVFDDGIVHVAALRAGIAPNTVLPIGVGVGAGWNRQDISNLDQRIDDRHVRGDVTVPLSPSFALVGGAGYEDVEISSRDAVRDVNGVPVLGADGRLQTDDSAPRQIAYQTDGLIWDVGVLWKPSRRTSLEAHFGRRYGSTTYYGSLGYAPNARTSLNVAVYDNLSGFGGVMVDALNALGTSFQAFRNPVTGDIGSCVASDEGGNCALGRIGSINSAVFRSRGVAASLSHNLGRTNLGLGAGYDRRRYIAAAGTALGAVDGVVDQNYWIGAYASRQLDRRSSLSFNTSASWFESGFDSSGDGIGYSASLSYYRNLVAGLSGTAAVSLDGITRDSLPDYSAASALLGLRYSF